MQATSHTAIDHARRPASRGWRGSPVRILVGSGLIIVTAAPAAAFDRPRREPDAKVQACPEVGEGYVRLPGSATCVKLSGLVRVEVAKIGGSR